MSKETIILEIPNGFASDQASLDYAVRCEQQEIIEPSPLLPAMRLIEKGNGGLALDLPSATDVNRPEVSGKVNSEIRALEQGIECVVETPKFY